MIASQVLHRLSTENPFHQFVENSTKVAVPEPTATTVTSACPAKATTLEIAAAETRTDLSHNDNPASLRSLDIECDNVDRQLHIHCRPQIPLTSLTSEDTQRHQKLTSDYKQQAAFDKLLHHSHTQSSSLPPFSPCLKNFIHKYHISTHTRTPVNVPALNSELISYPDRHFVNTLIDKLINGCNIGYTGPQFNHCSRNLHSAYQNPTTLDAVIAEERKLGRFLGPFNQPPLLSFRSSGLGLVPKHDGGWRFICHLSAPHGSSINDYIDPESFSLTYCSVDDAYAIVNALGTGALMSKIDLKNAFRLIPVRPNDWNLLGMQWRGKFYIDTFLPFGLRSAPFLFNQLSTAIHWILQHKYSIHHLLHYLDDFFTAGAPASQECSNNLSAMLSLCQRINAPVKPSKVEGPTTRLTFLGILIDTSTMTASITDERKRDLISSLQSLLQHSKCTKRQLLSLIGKLSFACKVIPAGRIFLRRLIDISCSVSRLHHHIRLTKEAHLDMYWWLNFLPQWNGSCCILQTEWTTSPAMDLYTDASGLHGWGAYWSGRWIQAQWPAEHIHKDITWKELYAIVAAVNTWGHLWKRKKVLFHCDNQSVCDIWQKGSTRQPETMALVRMLYFCAARFDIHVMTAHIAGTANAITDALSRLQVGRFKQLAPNAADLPDPIPAWPTQFCSSCSFSTNH